MKTVSSPEQFTRESLATVFVVGAPRSGTSWVQQLLASHPEVVSPYETGVFAEYLGAIYGRWKVDADNCEEIAKGLRSGAAPRRPYGLPVILERRCLDDLAASVVRAIADEALKLKPSARVLVEKTPNHSYQVRLLAEVLPGARFIHVVRDPRDVVRSMVRASSDWGDNWAPRTVGRAARTWAQVMGEVRRDRAYVEDRFTQVSYEGLREDAESTLTKLFEFCGVDVDREQAREIVDRLRLERQRSENTTSLVAGGEFRRMLGSAEYIEPEGFFGNGQRRRRLTKWDRWVIDHVAGEEILDLGYEPDRGWVGVGKGLELAFRAWWHVLRSTQIRTSRKLRRALRNLEVS